MIDIASDIQSRFRFNDEVMKRAFFFTCKKKVNFLGFLRSKSVKILVFHCDDYYCILISMLVELRSTYVEFLNEFGDDQKCPPSSNLLRFQNVAENVIAAVEHIFPLGAD